MFRAAGTYAGIGLSGGAASRLLANRATSGGETSTSSGLIGSKRGLVGKECVLYGESGHELSILRGRELQGIPHSGDVGASLVRVMPSSLRPFRLSS